MKTQPSVSQETLFHEDSSWFPIGVAAGSRRWIDVSSELEFPPLPGSPWMSLCLDLRIQARPHILRPPCACRMAAPGRVPLPTPFPIYQLAPRKGTPTETHSPALWKGEDNAKSVSFILPAVIKWAVILPCKNQYRLLIHYLKSTKFIISLPLWN